MKKELKILALLAFLIAIGIGAAAALYKDDSDAKERASPSVGMTMTEQYVRPDSPTLGPKTAPVTVVEFLDPECESCRAFFPEMKRVLKEQEGKIHFVVRYMGFHTSSKVAVAATEAAGLQGKYWEMQELLFANAEEWGHKPEPDKALFVKYAQTLGLDIDKFKTDLEDPKWDEKVRRDMADGQAVGVTGTPTIFVNGTRLRELSYGALTSAVASAAGFSQ